jgi:leader peptidase (prepilin peptidase)/N-methyltransferase
MISCLFEQRLPHILMLIVFAVVSPVLIFIDLEIKRIPNKITLVFVVLLIALSVIFPNFDSPISQQLQPLIVGLAISFFYLVLAIASKGGMGMGDAKLALPLGYLVAYFSWKQAVVSVIFAFFIGALYGAGQMLLRGKGRKHAIPFAPFMILGAWLAILAGYTTSVRILEFWTIQ